MDTETVWVIAIPDPTAEDFLCRFYDGTSFSKIGLPEVFFRDRQEAELVFKGLTDPDVTGAAYIKEMTRLVPPRVVEGSQRRISQSKYGLEEATDIHVIEAIRKNGQKIFEARIVVSDQPEDRIPDANPFDPKLSSHRAIATGAGDTLEQAVDLMLRCLKAIKRHPDNEGEEWKG